MTGMSTNVLKPHQRCRCSKNHFWNADLFRAGLTCPVFMQTTNRLVLKRHVAHLAWWLAWAAAPSKLHENIAAPRHHTMLKAQILKAPNNLKKVSGHARRPGQELSRARLSETNCLYQCASQNQPVSKTGIAGSWPPKPWNNIDLKLEQVHP